MNTTLKVRHLSNSTYQVVQFYINSDGRYEDESVLFQGNLAGCEAYIRLEQQGLLI